MSLSSVNSNQANTLTNSTNAVHFSAIKARMELAARQKGPHLPGTAASPQKAEMPGSAPEKGPGRLLNAYA